MEKMVAQGGERSLYISRDTKIGMARAVGKCSCRLDVGTVRLVVL